MMVRIRTLKGRTMYIRPECVFQVGEVDICDEEECNGCSKPKKRRWCIFTTPGFTHIVPGKEARKMIAAIAQNDGDDWREGRKEGIEG